MSLLFFPIMQEYFDPYIILFSLLILNLKFDLKRIKILGVFLYLVTFLFGANLYYYLKFA